MRFPEPYTSADPYAGSVAYERACDAVTPEEVAERIELWVRENPEEVTEIIVALSTGAHALNVVLNHGRIGTLFNTQYYSEYTLGRPWPHDLEAFQQLVRVASATARQHDEFLKEIASENMAAQRDDHD